MALQCKRVAVGTSGRRAMDVRAQAVVSNSMTGRLTGSQWTRVGACLGSPGAHGVRVGLLRRWLFGPAANTTGSCVICNM